MKITDYENGVSITVNPKGNKEQVSHIFFMSNEKKSMVNRLTDNEKTSDDEKFLNALSATLAKITDEQGISHVAFVDVDTEKSRSGASIFPMHFEDPQDYDFPDPKGMPSYEEVVAG